MKEPENTTTMQADLRAIDEALDSGTVTAADSLERELQELALTLRAEGRHPSPDFAADLRARVRDGFPREHRLPRPSRPRKPKLWRLPRARMPKLSRPALPVLAGMASVLVALTVVVSLQGEGGERAPSREGPESPDSAESSASGAPAGGAQAPRDQKLAQPRTLDSPAPGIAPEPPPGGGFAPGERKRRIERSASLTLAAPSDRLDAVANGIVRLTDRYAGFVLRSSLSTGADGTSGGSFELRIPADRLQAALGELSKLAEIRARTQSGQDVTPQFVSAAERLQAARAERRSLLRRLERAPTDSATEAIRRRLDLNAGEIRALRGQIRGLRTRTDYAGVSVALQAEGGDGGSSSPSTEDGLEGATDDALRSLGDSLEIAIRVLGVLVPLGVLGAALGLGARAVRRRRREAALG